VQKNPRKDFHLPEDMGSPYWVREGIKRGYQREGKKRGARKSWNNKQEETGWNTEPRKRIPMGG